MEEDPVKTYPAKDPEDIKEVKKKDKERHPPLGAMSPFDDGPWPDKGENHV